MLESVLLGKDAIHDSKDEDEADGMRDRLGDD